MKRTLATTLTLVLALPLLAEEAKKSEEKPAVQPAAQADSPLVAAAKRSKRLGKKPASKVITNETVKTSGTNAHVTTTANQTSLDAVLKQPPPAPTPEMVAAKKAEEQRKAAAAEEAKKREAERKRAQKVRAAAEGVEEEYPDDVDPAQAEKQIHDASAPQKPPR